MFNTVYTEIKKNLTRGNRRELHRLAVSLKKKGISGKLTKDERELLKKIDNHIERNHYESNIDREMIIDWLSRLNESPIYEFAAQQFVKDALKQSASEKAQIKCMEENGHPMNKMSASGKKSLRFDKESNSLIPTKTEGVTSRSFDYKREYDGFIEYLTGKVSFGQGGGQSNMKDEIVNFLKRSNKFLSQNPNSNFVFTALVDGDALTEKDKENYKTFTSDRVRLMSCDNYTPYEGNYNSI
jgi:hypothetical protein